MDASTALDEHLLKNLAWVFTVLSAVISIGLSIHRFGLSPGKRAIAIIGVLAVGVTVAFLFISDLSPLFKHFNVISDDDEEEVVDSHEKTHDNVNRISGFIFAVVHPDGKISAVYNGGFFDATINGRPVNCELIEISSNRVLIIKGGNDIETNDLTSPQEENTFKVQKVPVKPKPTS